MRSFKHIIWLTSGSILLLVVLANHSPTITFLYHTPNFLPALAFRFLALLLAVVLLGAFYGIGIFICPFIGLKIVPKYLQEPIFFFIGFLLASTLVYLLGFLRILYIEILLPVVFLGAWITIHKKSKSLFNAIRLFYWPRLGSLEKWTTGIIGLFLVGRLFPVLNFNSFGDPLTYSLPSGRDYLKGGGFQWFEQAEFYWQAGLSDIGLIYIHSLASHPMLLQLTAQAFYYLTGTLFLLLILHKGLFSKFVPEKHSLWIAFSFIAMGTFRLESIVAKPDYWLAILFCLILVLIYEILSEKSLENLLSYWTAVLMLSGLCVSTKPTSMLFLFPLATGMLFFGKHSIPWTAGKFWTASIAAAIFGLMNTFKSIYIFENPIFPFANNIFLSKYWDQTAAVGMRNSIGFESGSFIEFVHSFSKFFAGHPVSLILVVASFIWCFNYRVKDIINKPFKDYLKILSSSLFTGLILWVLIFSPHVFPRFIIGLVFMTLLLPAIIAAHHLGIMFLPNHQKWQNFVGGIALLLTLSVSHIDVDFQQARHWISSKSFHNQWIESSSLAEVQNYLNKNVNPKTRVLFNYTTQRFHANFIVYGARSFSPRTRFVYSKDKNEIKEGLKRIKPEYYVIRKDKIGTSGGLLAKKLFLDENFKLLKNFKEYLLYKVPKDFKIH